MTASATGENTGQVHHRVLLILGMHRSGSSLLGSICASLGINMGSRLIPPDQHNPAGYWEDADLVAIQENLLEALQQPWHGPRGPEPFANRWWLSDGTRPYREALDGLLRVVAAEGGKRGFKDPRTSRFLPLWRDLLPKHRLEPCFLLAVRDPREVVVSLMRRNGMDQRHALRIWVRYNLDAIRDSEGFIRLVVDYNRWFTESDAQLAALADVLAIPIDTEGRRRIRSERIRPDLRRSTAPMDLPIWANAIYEQLRALTCRALQPADFGPMLQTLEYWDTLLRHGGEAHAQSGKVPVAIAAPDIQGPAGASDIAIAYRQLARFLVAEGHPVTVLALSPHLDEAGEFGAWQRLYAEEGIALLALPMEGDVLLSPWHIARSWLAYRFLSRRRFPLVHIPDEGGCAYYSLLAQRQGIAFPDTRFCLGIHSPMAWEVAADRCFPDADVLECIHMETQSLALADRAVSSSAYMLGWLRQNVPTLPPQLDIIPKLTGQPDTASLSRERVPPLQEIVFFGRLDNRHGLALFIDAMETLKGRIPASLQITFLGENGLVGEEDGFSTVRRRTLDWPWGVQILGQYDHHTALAYLQRRPCIAVIPARKDNSPYAVQACLRLGISCILSHVGGIPELIHSEDRERLIPPAVTALAESVLQAVADTPTRPSPLLPLRPAFTEEQAAHSWRELHQAILAAPPPPAPVEPGDWPLVSVCLVHYQRPHLLAQAVASLEAADYPNMEVLLVDDGSGDQASHTLLDRLETSFTQRGWRIIRQENRYLGAARNAAARMARGEWLLFMDDDNLARPEEIRTLMRAAQNTHARIVTTAMDIFTGPLPPVFWERPQQTWVPLAGPCVAGIQRNVFGDANALVHRDTFLSLGGFTEDRAGHEDWEFFGRACLAGVAMLAVPEPLFWYRLSTGGMLGSGDSYRDHWRSLRPYIESQPADLADLPVLAHGQSIWRRNLTEARERRRFASEIYWGKDAEFSETRHTRDSFLLDHHFLIHLTLPPATVHDYRYLRWDPTDRPARLLLHACLLRVDGEILWRWDGRNVAAQAEIAVDHDHEGSNLYCLGSDPHLVFTLPDSIALRLAENGGLFEAELRAHHLDWREHEYLAAVRRRQLETENRVHIAALTAERDGNRADIAALTAEREGNRVHIAALTAELAALRASRSWRLTAPLRHLADLTRRLRQKR
ncbi:glycosyltransferase [Acidithiobacillus ferridurans]|jgi:glycosyltransferase involved in cell wall biosynthesis|uniref:glycosyltransferase n=1 Tax=Acidithiobacillus ferridurans TaxID=1232575 RepID=UPI001C071CAE|nr:glycosyltransferase [Acidithiobacillus ferridurans]MBU2731693.1 glycosyltransferase [Acidithiobacillus ferridurans]